MNSPQPLPCAPKIAPLRMIFLGRVFEWRGCAGACESDCWRDLGAPTDSDYADLVVFR